MLFRLRRKIFHFAPLSGTVTTCRQTLGLSSAVPGEIPCGFAKACVPFAELLRLANRTGEDNGGAWKVSIATPFLLPRINVVKEQAAAGPRLSPAQASSALGWSKRQLASLHALQSAPVTCLQLFQLSNKL